MARRNQGRRMHLNAEINVVSLIDVILLLLIIFMITAPMMAGGFDLELPSADVQPLESKDAIVVAMERDGTIKVDGKVWTRDQLAGAFKEYAKGRDAVTFLVDRNLTVGTQYEVMGILSNAGVRSFGMAGEDQRGRQ